MANASARKFEDELEDLEAVVTRIDSGELSLEESISAFERGVALVRSLNQKLDEVDKRVEVLIRGSNGELKISPYRGEGLTDANNEAPEEDDDLSS
jgi:exodeoxyribonuclease VII small subunit